MGSRRRRREGVALVALAACGGAARTAKPAPVTNTVPARVAPVACSVPHQDDLDDSLRMGQVFSVYAPERDRLVACLAKTGTSEADVDALIDGPSGRVTTVCVDGESGDVLGDCVADVMRSLQFPVATADTRFNFSLSN